MQQPATESQQHTIIYDDEIDLTELWQAILQGKKLITIMVSIAAILSIIIALLLPNIYRSEALLSPVSDDSTSGLASLANQFGGLANLAGISLGNGGDKTDLAIAILESRHFLTQFIKKHDLLVPVCAATGWNEETQKWILDDSLFDKEKRIWLPTKYTREGKGPSDWEAVKAFRDLLTVAKDKNTGLVTIGLELLSPKMAQQWMTWLIDDLNQYIKNRSISEAEASIAYLKKQADNTSVAEMRNVFYQLIEKQIQTMTLANIRDEYVFEVIDPPVIPEEHIKPNRALVCIGITLLSGIIAVFWSLIRYYREK